MLRAPRDVAVSRLSRCSNLAPDLATGLVKDPRANVRPSCPVFPLVSSFTLAAFVALVVLAAFAFALVFAAFPFLAALLWMPTAFCHFLSVVFCLPSTPLLPLPVAPFSPKLSTSRITTPRPPRLLCTTPLATTFGVAAIRLMASARSFARASPSLMSSASINCLPVDVYLLMRSSSFLVAPLRCAVPSCASGAMPRCRFQLHSRAQVSSESSSLTDGNDVYNCSLISLTCLALRSVSFAEPR